MKEIRSKGLKWSAIVLIIFLVSILAAIFLGTTAAAKSEASIPSSAPGEIDIIMDKMIKSPFGDSEAESQADEGMESEFDDPQGIASGDQKNKNNKSQAMITPSPSVTSAMTQNIAITQTDTAISPHSSSKDERKFDTVEEKNKIIGKGYADNLSENIIRSTNEKIKESLNNTGSVLTANTPSGIVSVSGGNRSNIEMNVRVKTSSVEVNVEDIENITELRIDEIKSNLTKNRSFLDKHEDLETLREFYGYQANKTNNSRNKSDAEKMANYYKNWPDEYQEERVSEVGINASRNATAEVNISGAGANVSTTADISNRSILEINNSKIQPGNFTWPNWTQTLSWLNATILLGSKNQSSSVRENESESIGGEIISDEEKSDSDEFAEEIRGKEKISSGDGANLDMHGLYENWKYEGPAEWVNPKNNTKLLDLNGTIYVHWLSDGRLSLIGRANSREIIRSWGWNASEIKPTTRDELHKYGFTFPMKLGIKPGTAIKADNSSSEELWLISGGNIKHKIVTKNAKTQYSGNTNQEIVLPQDAISTYDTGGEI